MKDQPKPATGVYTGVATQTKDGSVTLASGEWTVETVKFWDFAQIADAHNAAIAAVEKEWERIIAGHAKTNQDIVVDYQQQLADEKKNRETGDRVRETYVSMMNELREQLAAVTEERDNAVENCMSLSKLLYQTREDLSLSKDEIEDLEHTIRYLLEIINNKGEIHSI